MEILSQIKFSGTAGLDDQALRSRGGALLPAWETIDAGAGTPQSVTPAGAINGVNTVFTLPSTPSSSAGVLVVLDSGLQYNGPDYTVSGSTITFVEAPATNSSIHAYYNVVAGGGGGGDVTLTGIQTLTNKTLTSPVINTPTGIVKSDVGLANVDNTSDATKNAATVTFTNKRITTRVTSIASTATLTIDVSVEDQENITALAANLTIAAPIGTPVDGDKIMIRIKDNGTARAITWNAIFRAIGVTLPATTIINKTVYIGAIYNTTDTKWDVIAVAQES